MAVHDNYHCPSVDFLRISATDRCNQRCFYCMPHGDIPLFEHTEILRYEEILTSVRAVVKTEFRKFRLAGGEPLGHKNIFEPIREMLGIDGIEEAMLTTNGARLENKEIDIKFPRRAGCDERRLIDLKQRSRSRPNTKCPICWGNHTFSATCRASVGEGLTKFSSKGG